MKGTKELNTNKGITLIALIITIIVMLILVGVTISMAVNGGLFDYAGKAAKETNDAIKAEGNLGSGLVNVNGQGNQDINSIVDSYVNGTATKTPEKVETISKTDSYVGYYADVDGDGDPDGIIYADLAKGNTGDGEWFDSDGTYTIPKETDLTLLKDYCISRTYDGVFNEEGEPKGVIKATGTGGTKDRFYVMALSNLSTSEYTWYASKASTGLEVITSGDFGTGKANTVTMIETWNEDTDEAKSNNDVWGVIQNSDEYDIVETANDSGKWFLPSRAEWSAFCEELSLDWIAWCNIDEGRDYYWTSSQKEGTKAWFPGLSKDCFNNTALSNGELVRLSATF